MIDRPQGVTVDDAAHDLACTVRAPASRYTPSTADGNRGAWRVTEEFKRAMPLKLALGKLVALLMTRDLLTPLGVSVLGPEVGSAFDKIQGSVSGDSIRIIEQMRNRLDVEYRWRT